MRKQQFKRWQVIVGFVLFMAVMGIVGKVDQDSQQAILDERVNVRDQVQASVSADENQWTAYYVKRSRGDR